MWRVVTRTPLLLGPLHTVVGRQVLGGRCGAVEALTFLSVKNMGYLGSCLLVESEVTQTRHVATLVWR